MSYEAFGIQVGNLGDLEWQSVCEPSQDGESWIVQEKGGAGYRFRASLSDRERNSTPCGTKPLARDDFPSPDDVRKAVALAIEREIVSSVLDAIAKGQEYQVTVTCFDLYKAARAL